MGRYYSGDINGKFWFAVQSSTAADRFGSSYYEPNYVQYTFDESHLEECEAEIQRILDNLGDKKQVLDDFFSKPTGYTDKDMEDLGISKKELEDYADLELGIQIRDCIKENGECNFDAEI